MYMAMGMSYDEFWNGTADSARAYRAAYKIKQDEQKTFAWMQGAYVYEAIGAWAPILRAFSKARRPAKYPKEPYDLERPTLTPEQREDAEHRHEDKQFIAFMTTWADSFNANFKKKAGEADARNGTGN